MTNNLHNVIARIQSKEVEVTNQVAEYIKQEAEKNTPVDTGHLKDSWEIRKHGEKSKVQYIGNTAEYAIYVEKGTRKTPARHMLSKAIENHKSKIQEIAEGVWTDGND